MKNLIFKYEEYRDQIFKGDPISIKYATFVGISFKETCMQIYFECISTAGELIGLALNTIFENVADFEKYHDLYCDIPVVGMVNSLLVPTLTSVSCFHKNKTDYETTYDIYGRHVGSEENNKVVYKLKFKKPAYIAVMKIMELLYSYHDIDYNSCVACNLVPPERKSIHINDDYKVIVRKLYAVKEDESIFDKIIGKPLLKADCFAKVSIVLFTLKSKDSHYRIIMKIPMTNSEIDKVNKNFITGTLDGFTKFEETLEKEETYVIDDLVNLEYALSADNPMKSVLVSAIAYVRNNSESPIGDPAGKYFEIKNNVFENLTEEIYNQLYQ